MNQKYLDGLVVALKSIALEKRSIALAKKEEERSPYLTEALNYLNKFWDGIFAFLKDGRYPIDNMAERTIRKLTIQRNSMLHFGSDEGVEMAATYHSIISTVKLHGMSCWKYLGEFFKKKVQASEKKTCLLFSECSLSYAKIFNGYRDYVSMTPKNNRANRIQWNSFQLLRCSRLSCNNIGMAYAKC